MLRECRRVLKREGRLAVLVIETMPGLSEGQTEAATDLGPSAVGADESLEEMARMVGFEVQYVEDVTHQFETTAARCSLPAMRGMMRLAQFGTP